MDDEERKLADVLGTNLRTFRQARDLTQAGLAERAELSPHYVALLETARKLPTLKALNQLARALGTAPGELLGGGEREPDAWVSELGQLAASIPESSRALVREILRSIARHVRATPSPKKGVPPRRATRRRKR